MDELYRQLAALAKRHGAQKQVLTLVPANRAYRPRTYSGPELKDIQIEGLATGFTHWF